MCVLPHALLYCTAGKKIPYNQRDAPWSTWTARIGFPVMGIWPDYSDRTDINAVCRSKRGAPRFEPRPSATVRAHFTRSTHRLNRPTWWCAIHACC